MRKFLTLLRISVIDAFEYRADMAIFVLSGISQPIVLLGMWLGVLASGGTTPMSRDGFIQYYILLLIVSLLTSAWASYFIANKVRLGDLSPHLLKPAHYFMVLLSENLGEKFVKLALIVPVLLIIIYLFNPVLPTINFLSGLLFVISLIFAMTIVFTVDVLMGLLAFWMDDNSAVENFYDALLFIFSGRLIPLAVMPVVFQNLGTVLPFRYSLSFPIEIILGQTTGINIALGFFWQILWMTLSIIGLFFVWNRGLKRYSASGA